MRIGLGYVSEVAEVDARAVIDERARGGSYRSIADLAGRSGAGAAALQRLAWAGACDTLVRAPLHSPGTPLDPEREQRRPALWEVGAVARSTRTDEGAQLALPLGGAVGRLHRDIFRRKPWGAKRCAMLCDLRREREFGKIGKRHVVVS